VPYAVHRTHFVALRFNSFFELLFFYLNNCFGMKLKRKCQAIFSYIRYSSLDFPRYFITLEYSEVLYLADRQCFRPDKSKATLWNSYELNIVRAMFCALIESKVDPFKLCLTGAASRLEFVATRN
jgi:hypothetical protein